MWVFLICFGFSVCLGRGIFCLFVLGLFSWFGFFFVVSLGRQTYSQEGKQGAFCSV